MYSKVLHEEQSPESVFYDYLLQWEWPGHIESQLRRLIWSKLNEVADQDCDLQEAPSDFLAAQLAVSMASYPETNPTILNVLADVKSAAIAQRVAENPRTCSDTLSRLARHDSANVRAAVAENLNCSDSILAALAADCSVDVKYSMAENHNLPEAILTILADDENGYVSARANKTLNRKKCGQALIKPFAQMSPKYTTKRKVG